MATRLCARRRGFVAPGVVPLRALALGLFGLSFATAVFTLSLFKLLSFFIMPSLFFDLLFIGFPVGAFLAARWLPAGRESLLRSLWALQFTMAASVGACLLAKRFDYLRAHLFDVELTGLVGQIAIFAALFLPFFAAYGACEYLGYQYGRLRLGGKMRAVYAIALFGAATAYVFLRVALPALGMARIQLLAFASAGGAIMALGAGTLDRKAARFEIAVLALVFLVPGLEPHFLALYKGRGEQSTYDFKENLGCHSVYERWGRYSLCEILEANDKSAYYGFYNDMFQWEYSPRMGFTGVSLGALPILGTKPGQSLAIIGAGGGRQVRLAERLGERTILALELEPAVFDAVRSPAHLLRQFDRVYEMPGVRPVRAEARGYFERTAERFDLIYLPSVGGYAQMMIEPGNMIRTFEAYRLLRDHLTDSGLLAIWYPLGLDTKGVLTDQYVRTLRALGMPTAAYRNTYEWLILAGRDQAHAPPTAQELVKLMGLDPQAPDAPALLPAPYEVAPDPQFVPIRDERPYLAGNLRYILSTRQVATLFALAVVFLIAGGVAVWAGLRRRGDPQIPGRSYAAAGGLAILIGANFLLVEHAVVLAFFRKIFVYDDALALAAVSFLAFSGLGSLLAARLPRRWVLCASAIGMVWLILGTHRAPLLCLLVAEAPVAFATGAFFPALFERAAANPLAVFALDAVGAGVGAVLAMFVPLLWGFGAFFTLTAALFALTAAADAWFHHGLPESQAAQEAQSHQEAAAQER